MRVRRYVDARFHWPGRPDRGHAGRLERGAADAAAERRHHHDAAANRTAAARRPDSASQPDAVHAGPDHAMAAETASGDTPLDALPFNQTDGQRTGNETAPNREIDSGPSSFWRASRLPRGSEANQDSFTSLAGTSAPCRLRR